MGDPLVVPPPTGPLDRLLRTAGGGPEKPDKEPADLRDGDRDMDGAARPPFFIAPMVGAARASRASVI